jgi:hypothetical protein
VGVPKQIRSPPKKRKRKETRKTLLSTRKLVKNISDVEEEEKL